MDLARKTAYEVLLEIEKEGAYSNLTLNRFIEKNNLESGAFVRELVYGVLENKILLDYYLNKLIPSGIKKVKKKEATFLRMGLYQMMFMDSVPDYAAINETVTLAKKLARGREGFVNGVLRGYLKRRDELVLPNPADKDYLSVKYSFPQWLIDMWQKQYGKEKLESLLEASNMRPQMSIRANISKVTRDELAAALTQKGFEVEKGRFSERTLHVKGGNVLGTEEFKNGLFAVQDEASTVACDLLDAKPGDTVIDVCAAPGGKTCAIAEMMKNEGRVFSCDIYEHKLELIEEQAKRLGLDIVKTNLLDGTRGNSGWYNAADRVLADVPCSGLGVIRRKPEIKYKGIEDFAELVEIQRQVLENASRYVKSGGVLVYSTCTVNKDENEDQVEKFLKSHEDFEPVYQKQFLPTEGIDGFYVCKMTRK